MNRIGTGHVTQMARAVNWIKWHFHALIEAHQPSDWRRTKGNICLLNHTANDIKEYRFLFLESQAASLRWLPLQGAVEPYSLLLLFAFRQGPLFFQTTALQCPELLFQALEIIKELCIHLFYILSPNPVPQPSKSWGSYSSTTGHSSPLTYSLCP